MKCNLKNSLILLSSTLLITACSSYPIRNLASFSQGNSQCYNRQSEPYTSVVDSHIHFICPQQIPVALASGVTTLIGGGTGRVGARPFFSIKKNPTPMRRISATDTAITIGVIPLRASFAFILVECIKYGLYSSSSFKKNRPRCYGTVSTFGNPS